jgi:two-component system chemotaxis response regulator CheB
VFTCPDCGGALREVGESCAFRCHVGHAFSNAAFLSAQAGALDGALWSALRALEESAALRARMAVKAWDGGLEGLARGYEAQAAQAKEHARAIRELITQNGVQAAADEGNAA